MKELAQFLRKYAEWHESGVAGRAPEVVAEVKKLREWATEVYALQNSNESLINEIGCLYESGYNLAQEVHSRDQYIIKLQKEVNDSRSSQQLGGADLAESNLTDAKINEITYNKLGTWPSFEAQSWACKVVHAVLCQEKEHEND